MALERGRSEYQAFKVVVIEDQPFVRKTIVQLLGQLGLGHISEAEDGESGLRECQRANPDVIICDIDMRPVNGLEFLTRLRASTGIRNPRTPVIFLTKHTESEIVRQALALGVNAFVVKPPTLPALRERVDRFLFSS
jgi:two-component system chemotaxis response regulator CheY